MSCSLLRIKTPADFKRLKAGEIGTNYHVVYVELSAHPDSFNEISSFASSDLQEIHFFDVIGNRLILRPAEKVALAKLKFSQGLLRFLPKNYRSYIIFNGEAIAPTDIDAILRWQSAERIQIEDQSDAATQLERHSKRLSELTKLTKFGISVQFLFEIRNLLKALTHVQVVEFYCGEFWDDEMVEEYFQKQINLLSFKKSLVGRTIQYTRI